MQIQKSFSDSVREARAAREADRRRVPEGYFSRGVMPENSILNLNAPGVFRGNAPIDAAALNRAINPYANVSKMPVKPAPVQQPQPSNIYNQFLEYGGSRPPSGQYINVNEMPEVAPMQLSGSYQGSDLGDFITDLTQAITAGATAYGQVSAAEALQRTGISPVGYSVYGTPLYQSTPAGVTPQNGSMVPSGMVLPPGVTPTYPYPVGFVQQAGASGAYQIQPPQSFVSNAEKLLPVLAIGGGLVLLFVLMK
jgi:hypothetical protein